MSRRTWRGIRTPKYEQPALMRPVLEERPATRLPPERRSGRMDGGSDPGSLSSETRSNHRPQDWSIPISCAATQSVLSSHGTRREAEGDSPLDEEEEDDDRDRDQRRGGHHGPPVDRAIAAEEVREPDRDRLVLRLAEEDVREDE